MADEVANLLVRITADGSQATGVLNGVASTVTTLADKNASLMNKISATGQLAGKVGSTITKTFGVATVAGIVASAKASYAALNRDYDDKVMYILDDRDMTDEQRAEIAVKWFEDPDWFPTKATTPTTPDGE